MKRGLRREKKGLWSRVKTWAKKRTDVRTGWPPIRETATSAMSVRSSMGPSGRPRRTVELGEEEEEEEEEEKEDIWKERSKFFFSSKSRERRRIRKA